MNKLSTCSLTLAIAFGSSITQAEETETVNWEGLYTGIAIGISSSTASPSTEVEYSGYFNDNSNGSDRDQLDPILQREIEGDTTSGSLLLGYHFQKGKFVYGLEADLTFAEFSESESEGPTDYDTTAGASNFTTVTEIKTDYMFSLRPKVGYVKDNFLMHISAGPVISEFTTTHSYTDTHGSGASLSFEDKDSSVGLSANIGIDYLISNGLSIRADYTYLHFSDILDGSGDVNSDGSDDITYGSDFTSQNIRLALTKQF
ncbi:putative outer-membrane immunogenic protein precursor [Marinomonas sp. MED121]|uniref:outer membrane protein n=1 Tax=Marinomonas sp. MED121 TaxID=314277 RepID=UPI000069103D|nr:outer membrane beta-barrel protein [Marinomonas sp. MED121]EAQ67561.1 putative outer-membrane immunogenic protein precursor [Marinomonas sp. MED121]EAQ67564.1 putative outer-membrane immunogenic protein precursor [Marinomonas sp. MED121]